MRQIISISRQIFFSSSSIPRCSLSFLDPLTLCLNSVAFYNARVILSFLSAISEYIFAYSLSSLSQNSQDIFAYSLRATIHPTIIVIVYYSNPLSIFLSIFISIHPFILLTLSPSPLSIHPSLYQSLYLSLYLPLYLTIQMPISHYTYISLQPSFLH
jgi:hypothetical protein